MIEKKFKAGDMVRCIDAGGSILVHGEVYEVCAVGDRYIDILINGIAKGGFFTSRFEFVGTKPKSDLERYLEII